MRGGNLSLLDRICAGAVCQEQVMLPTTPLCSIVEELASPLLFWIRLAAPHPILVCTFILRRLTIAINCVCRVICGLADTHYHERHASDD